MKKTPEKNTYENFRLSVQGPLLFTDRSGVSEVADKMLVWIM